MSRFDGKRRIFYRITKAVLGQIIMTPKNFENMRETMELLVSFPCDFTISAENSKGRLVEIGGMLCASENPGCHGFSMQVCLNGKPCSEKDQKGMFPKAVLENLGKRNGNKSFPIPIVSVKKGTELEDLAFEELNGILCVSATVIEPAAV